MGMTDPPRRCLRVGCPRPRSDPDRVGLGLCDEHNHQLAQGTIGEGMDPTVREHPVAQAQELVADMRREGESIRGLARRTGLSKDLLWHVTRGTFTHVRSEAWEEILEAHARLEFERRHPVWPNRRPLGALAAEILSCGQGVQLALFDP